MNSVSDIYDALHAFENKQKKGAYPVHKHLRSSNKNDGLIDWLIQNLDFRPRENILDAGCGVGHTLFALAKEKEITGRGISISKKEIEHANTCLKNQGENCELTFEVRDFHDLTEGCYDKVIAIESLKHARDVKKVISNFSKVLKTDGRLIIADDFIIRNDDEAERHKLLWNAPAFLPLPELVKIISGYGFEIRSYDLTAQTPVRSPIYLSFLLGSVALLRSFSRNRSRVNLDTYSGALLLEKLYKSKKVQYCVVVATKPGNG